METLERFFMRNILLFSLLFISPFMIFGQIDEQRITRFQQFGNDVSISGDWAIVGNMWADYSANGGIFYEDAGAAYIFKLQPNGNWVENTMLTEQCWYTSTLEQHGINYGKSVSITDGWAVVGAPAYDSNDEGSIGPDGVVYVYKLDYDTDTWSLHTVLSEEIDVLNQFGWDVAIEGNKIVVGDNSEQHNNGAGVDQHNIGCAYVYTLSNDSWGTGTKLIASDGWGTPGGIEIGPGDEFGYSVDIHDDNIIIGAKNKGVENGANSNKGGAYIFEWDGANWVETIISPVSLNINDEFGTDVGIRNNYAIVGAPGVSGSANSQGRVFVYKTNNGNWNLLQTINASDGGQGDIFGTSVSVGEQGSTSKFLVGAPLWDGDAGSAQGASYLLNYDQANNTWTESILTASDAQSGDEFGYSLSIDNTLNSDNMIVGAWKVDEIDGGFKEGAVYLYSLQPATLGMWDGSESGDWGDPSNWTDNLVPNGATDVIIPTGVPNMPIINEMAFCRNLTIETNATLGFSGTVATLQVNGDLLVQGNFTPNDPLSYMSVGGTTTFTSTEAQNMPHGSYQDVNIDKDRNDDVYMVGDVEILGQLTFPTGSDYGKADLIIGSFQLTLYDYVGGNDRNLFGDENSSLVLTGDPVISYKIPGRIYHLNNLTIDCNRGVDEIGSGTLSIHGTLYLFNGLFLMSSNESIAFYEPISGTLNNFQIVDGSTGTMIWVYGSTAGFVLPSTITNVGSLINENSETIAISNDIEIEYYLWLYNGELNTNGHNVRFSPVGELWSRTDITFGNGLFDPLFPPAAIKVLEGEANINADVGEVDEFEVNNQSVGARIGPAGSISVSTTINIDSDFSIDSDASGTGSFIDYTATRNRSNVTAKVENYLEAGQWHYVSSPVAGATADVFYFPGSSTSWIKYYDETISDWQYITDINTPLEVGKGYAVWISASRINETAEYDGVLNNGDYTVNLDYSGVDKGFNLVGNPFPSSLDWDQGTWNHVNTTAIAYVWNNGNYITRNSIGQGTLTDGIIPPGQGFFVQASDAGASISLPQDARVHGGQNLYKKNKRESKIENTDFLKVRVSDGIKEDQTWISFHELASNNWDMGIDAERLDGADDQPQLYTKLDSKKMSLQVFEPLLEAHTVPVYFKATENGIYTLTFDYMESFENATIWLVDKNEDIWVNLDVNNTYEFSSNSQDNPDRFTIHFYRGITNISNSEIAKTEKFKIWSSNNAINIKRNNTDEKINKIEIVNMLGQTVSAVENPYGDIQTITLNTDNIYVIVRVYTNSDIVNEKVFIKNN